jgi:hypothetical protein
MAWSLSAPPTPNHLGFATWRLRRFQFQPTLRYHQVTIPEYSVKIMRDPMGALALSGSLGSVWRRRLIG